MYLIAVIFFIAFGVFLLGIALWHEFSWWNRRRWTNDRGTIVGYSESYNDGVSYHPEIEFQGSKGPVRFVSKYGSGKMPDIGDSVDILIDDSGDSAEEISASNRLVFTIVPILFGVVCILLGANIGPTETAEKDANDRSSTAADSKAQ